MCNVKYPYPIIKLEDGCTKHLCHIIRQLVLFKFSHPSEKIAVEGYLIRLRCHSLKYDIIYG